jgi:diacylglycerol kinase (ATP)
MTCPRVIVNPIAGRGRGARVYAEIASIFEGHQQPLELMLTTRPGDATRWAYEAAEQGVPSVIGAGGDGTANEIVNGLANWVNAGGDPARLPALGVISCGTGNDFGYNFTLPLDVSTACERLFAGRTRLIDVGRVQSDLEAPLYFVNGVGIGFDAIVNIESRKLRFVRGGAAFLPAVLKTMLFYYHAPRVVVESNDGGADDRAMMISVMNGERFGAMFYMTPGCKIDDGKLSLCLVKKLSRPAMLQMVYRFIRGSHPGHPKVVLLSTDAVTLRMDEPMPAHVEGEIYSMGASRYEFSLAPWQLRMIY